MQNNKKELIAAAACYVLFLLLILLLKTVDVKAVGPSGSSVGFAALNSGFFKLVGEHPALYKLSAGIGFLALATVPFFAFLGLLQLVKGKSLSAVDRDLYLLAVYYAVIFAVYLLFEKIIVNYRPVLEDGELAASFPSSHTMFGITLLGAAALQFKRRLADQKLRTYVILCCQFLIVLLVLARLFSGVHWLTDILGGVLIGSALLLTYDLLSKKLMKMNKPKQSEE